METMLFRINASGHDALEDESLIKKMMEKLLAAQPKLAGYQWEREDGYINILVWGEIGQ